MTDYQAPVPGSRARARENKQRARDAVLHVLRAAELPGIPLPAARAVAEAAAGIKHQAAYQLMLELKAEGWVVDTGERLIRDRTVRIQEPPVPPPPTDRPRASSDGTEW